MKTWARVVRCEWIRLHWRFRNNSQNIVQDTHIEISCKSVQVDAWWMKVTRSPQFWPWRKGGTIWRAFRFGMTAMLATVQCNGPAQETCMSFLESVEWKWGLSEECWLPIVKGFQVAVRWCLVCVNSDFSLFRDCQKHVDLNYLTLWYPKYLAALPAAPVSKLIFQWAVACRIV